MAEAPKTDTTTETDINGLNVKEKREGKTERRRMGEIDFPSLMIYGQSSVYFQLYC